MSDVVGKGRTKQPTGEAREMDLQSSACGVWKGIKAFKAALSLVRLPLRLLPVEPEPEPGDAPRRLEQESSARSAEDPEQSVLMVVVVIGLQLTTLRLRARFDEARIRRWNCRRDRGSASMPFGTLASVNMSEM